jgi:hypothetical protein
VIKEPIQDPQHNVKDQIESKNRCRIHIHTSSDRKSTTFKKFTTHTRVFAHRHILKLFGTTVYTTQRWENNIIKASNPIFFKISCKKLAIHFTCTEKTVICFATMHVAHMYTQYPCTHTLYTYMCTYIHVQHTYMTLHDNHH